MRAYYRVSCGLCACTCAYAVALLPIMRALRVHMRICGRTHQRSSLPRGVQSCYCYYYYYYYYYCYMRNTVWDPPRPARAHAHMPAYCNLSRGFLRH